MRQVLAYIRVSTAGQGKSGLGVEAQRAALARFVEAEACEILREFFEVETGKGADAIDRRPQLAAALALAKKSKAAVVAAKLAGFRGTWRSFPTSWPGGSLSSSPKWAPTRTSPCCICTPPSARKSAT